MFSQQNEPYCVLIQTFAKICKSPGFSYGEGRTFLNLGPSLDFEGKHYWYSPPHTHCLTLSVEQTASFKPQQEEFVIDGIGTKVVGDEILVQKPLGGRRYAAGR